MTTADLSPDEAARWALRAGLPLEAGRPDTVAATANHIQNVIAVLRELDFGETAPAATYQAAYAADALPDAVAGAEERADAAV
ncbi:hypothetical protein [Streptantibioticus ferralitis]|uniref:Amidase n=1 Tax=Streptantibioticus ferralitis TaxID=236510 RepID=A0ABT5YYT0_9ACTN|nr:hypothetical protein [Streptantibioticus ferralitis]MDF2256709.1 hypothetical protein [Streptantibioticus ferralitis]